MLFFHLILTLFMLAVIYFDVTKYIIPNWLNAVIILLFPAMIIISPIPIDWLSSIYAILITFVIGFIIFTIGIMGAGDIKLLCAGSLWCGIGNTLIAFILYTAILGGVLAIGLFIIRPIAAWFRANRTKGSSLPVILTHGQPVPYGLAISFSFLIILWSGKMVGLPLEGNIINKFLGL